MGGGQMPSADDRSARLMAELRRLAIVSAWTKPGMRCRVCGSCWPCATPRGPKLERHEPDCLLEDA